MTQSHGCSRCPPLPLLPPFTSLSVSTLSSYDTVTGCSRCPPPPTPLYLPGTLVSTLTSYDTVTLLQQQILVIPSYFPDTLCPSLHCQPHMNSICQSATTAPPPPHTHTNVSALPNMNSTCHSATTGIQHTLVCLYTTF